MLPYLRTRELVLPRHQQHLVRWVRDFLLFAEEQGGYIFEQTLDLFLTAVGERVGIKSWQIQQAVGCSAQLMFVWFVWGQAYT